MKTLVVYCASLLALSLFCGCAKLNPYQTYNPYLPGMTGKPPRPVKERVDDFNKELAEEYEQQQQKKK